MTPEQKQSTRTTITLFAIFLLPLILAYVFYHWRIPLGPSTNHGLLRPDLPTLNELAISDEKGTVLAEAHKWSVLYLLPENCDSRCQRKLFFLHQMSTALRGDSNRMDKWVLITPSQSDPNLSNPLLATIATEYQLNIGKIATLHDLQPGFIYLADPNGNLILAYTKQSSMDDVLADLRHLLKASQIG